MKNSLIAMLLGMTAFVSGCSILHHSDTHALQGTWRGYELGRPTNATYKVSFSGNTLDYRGASPSDWCKGTFTLREDTHPKQLIGVMTECVDTQFVGKAVHAIYKIEQDTLTLSGKAPGNAEAPTDFGADYSRTLVLKKQQN